MSGSASVAVQPDGQAEALRAILLREMARRRAGGFGKVVPFREGWRIDARPHGYIYSFDGKTFGDDRQLADAVLLLIRASIDRGTPEAEAVAPYLSRPVMGLYHRWLDVKRAEAATGKRSPRTVAEYVRYARRNGEVAWWEGRNVSGITAGTLEAWELWMAQRGLAPKTRYNVLGAFRTFCGWLDRQGVLPKIPAFPEVERESYAPTILTPAQQRTVLDAIPEVARGAFLAGALMGLRPGEIRALSVADYTAPKPDDLGLLVVARAMKGQGPDAPIGPTKNRRVRTLPVAPDLAAWIALHVPAQRRLEGGPLFLNPRTGRRWSHWALRDAWIRACEAVGFAGVPFYEGTKHSFATDAYERTADERAVQEYLGHADAKSTRRYAQMQRSALVKVIKKP